VQRGDIVPRPKATPLSEWLADGRTVNRANLKQRLYAAGLNPAA